MSFFLPSAPANFSKPLWSSMCILRYSGAACPGVHLLTLDLRGERQLRRLGGWLQWAAGQLCTRSYNRGTLDRTPLLSRKQEPVLGKLLSPPRGTQEQAGLDWAEEGAGKPPLWPPLP